VAHPYRIREIAVQAGLSERTVDRVLKPRRRAGQHRWGGAAGHRRP
jgi:predicted transcriptional regulator